MSYNINAQLNVEGTNGSLRILPDPTQTQNLTINSTITANDLTITLGNQTAGQCLAATSTTDASWKNALDVQAAGVSLNANYFHTLNFTSPVTATSAGSGVANIVFSPSLPTVRYYDTKAIGTAGGGSVKGSWLTRTLNTADAINNITGASLASNVITLPTGTYYVVCRAPFHGPGQSRLRFYNVTNAAVGFYGPNCNAPFVTYDSHHPAIGFVKVTAASNDFRLEYRCALSIVTDGLGLAATGTTGASIYSTVVCVKIA